METLSFKLNNDLDKVSLFERTIESFNGAAAKFEREYRLLELRVKELDLELRNKNKALKNNLEEKEAVKDYLNNILESLTTGVVVIDTEGKITTFNRAAANLTGFKQKKVIGKAFDEFFGSFFISKPNLDFRSIEDIRTDAEFETEIHGGPKNIHHVSVSISPVRNSQGKKIGIVLTVQDITQLKKLEQQANRTSRLAAMGEMAAEIAHEVRNPLGSIELFASTLKKDLKDFKESRVLADHISSGVRSINNIVSNLLIFSRPHQRIDFKTIDIYEVLNDSLFFSSHLIESNDSIEILTRYSPIPLMVLGDSELLKQISLNLILNAIQSMPNGGRLTISAKKINGREEKTNFVQLRFADNGKGICQGDMHRIFDPFFTTKKSGTGLGLAIVHNIIKLHGGTIDIVSAEGEGTECVVVLPLCA